MTLQEVQQSDWYKERPTVIQQAINKLPPIHVYRFKDSKKQCTIHSYEEPENCKLEDVTVTVYKTGHGGAMAEMGMGMFDTNGVFDVKLDDLEICPESEIDKEDRSTIEIHGDNYYYRGDSKMFDDAIKELFKNNKP